MFRGSSRRVRRPFSTPTRARPRLEPLEDRRLLATFLVTNTNDSGDGSLRQAILNADGGSGGDTIQFAIDSGVQTIRALSPLPALSQAMTIDGTTQPGFAGSPLVVVNGNQFDGGTNGYGLRATAAGVTVLGLVVDGFHGAQVRLEAPGGDVVAGNYLGTDVTGTQSVPWIANSTDHGLDVFSSNNSVGGLNAGDGNLISGLYFGAYVRGNAAHNVFEGNRIGTDASGTVSVSNYFGVYVQQGGHDNTFGGTAAGAGNLISGNRGLGIFITTPSASGNRVEGNLIGTDVTGSTALANALSGVVVDAPNTQVGGADPGAGNVISGNTSDGVEVSSGSGVVIQGNLIGTDVTGTVAVPNGLSGNGDGVILFPGASGTTVSGNVISGNHRFGLNMSSATAAVVQGNRIGTDASGTQPLGNGSDGVLLGSTGGALIGGTAPGAGNVISANGGAGIDILGLASNNDVIQGNLIGTDASGTQPLGNASDGVQVFFGANDQIGGTVAGAGNVIGANGGAGVLLSGTTALVLGNFIGTDVSGSVNLGNAGDGVSITTSTNNVGGTAAGAGNTIAFNGNDGVKVSGGTGNAIRANSIHDSTTLGIELVNGGNNNQPAPVLSSATTTGSSITIQGTFSGTANTSYALDFFANPTANPSGAGEGQQFLGSASVTTNGSGTVSFTVTFTVAVPQGEAISATATSPARNTSAFAQDVTVTQAATWVPLGPAPLSFTYPAPENFSGRIVGIAPSPTDPNTIYIAAASGGVWKTTDGGSTWLPLTDDQVTLSMGAIALAPSDPNVIYAGTGEANNAGSYYGRGILVSTDGGATWALTGAGTFDRLAIAKIAVDPTDPNTAYAAVNDFADNGRPFAGGTGIFKTTDGGAHWANTTAALNDQFDPYSDVVIDPSNPSTVYMAIGDHFGDAYHTGGNGVYKSTDAGAHWTKLGGGLPADANAIGRVSLAVAPSDSQVIYVSISGTGHGVSTAHGTLFKLMRSDDGGATWTDLMRTDTPNYMAFQGDYDTTLIVDPSNPSVVYAGGAAGPAFGEPPAVIRSADGGVTWSDLDLTGVAVTPHADHHGIAFDANGNLLDGNDGGLFRLDSASPVAWSDLNGNLNTIQFEGGDISPTGPNVAIGGSQDNGTMLYSGDPLWSQTDGGDGGWAKFSPTNPNRVYHQAPAGSFGTGFFRRSDDGGNTWVSKTTNLVADINNQNFYAPFVVDPGNGDRVLYGTDRVWETTTGGDSWAPISPVLTGANIDAIGVAAGNANTVYASFGGQFANTSRIFVTADHGATWVEHDLPAGSGRVADLEVDPTNPQVAYAVVGRFGGGHVFRTTNGGGTWTDISGNLPDLPTWTLQLGKPASGDVLYVGNDDGVYVSTDLGASWARLSTGLPHVQVLQLALNANLQLLAAATHGRGMWELSLAGSGPPPVTPGPGGPPFSAAGLAAPRFSAAPGPARAAGAATAPGEVFGLLPPLGGAEGEALPLPTAPLLAAGLAPAAAAPLSLTGPPPAAPVLAAGVTGALDRFLASAADDLGAALVRADRAAPADDWWAPLVEPAGPALAAPQAPA
jgi:photosystem II stability/assembly factor-like uncharacterized protein